MNFDNIQNTTDNKIAGSIRLMMAIMFLMAGPMKLVVPMLGEAWSGQLIAADLPFYTLTKWSVPFIETALGIVLAMGLYTRLAVIVVTGIMTVAAYVHIVVNDPSLFPLQPNEPIIPIVAIAMSFYLLWKGAGAWSRDLRNT